MKRLTFIIVVVLTCFACGSLGYGQDLNFDKTLRLNYIFSGTSNPATAEIALANMCWSDNWYGRRVNLDSVPLQGAGRITLRDSVSGKILYANSFSTLFQEWVHSEEATRVRKSFENVFLVPMPSKTATVTVELYNADNQTVASYTNPVNPDDILIRHIGGSTAADTLRYRWIHKGGDPAECIDIAIVAEGYTAAQADLFYADAANTAEWILEYEPFKSFAGRINFVAVPAVSKESGVSIPHDGLWVNTALGAHFDTFYSDRYLTTLNLFDLHDALAGIPYEHIIILANTDNYGGGGIYNSYVLSAAHNRWAKPVVVHEFGHSFGGLADEYFYDDAYENFYKPDVEPWEPNITTLADFGSKWMDMLPSEYQGVSKEELIKLQVKVEAQPKGRISSAEGLTVGLYEGGGYMSASVWRPFLSCRMRDNTFPFFCPVCERAIRRLILFNTEQIKKQ